MRNARIAPSMDGENTTPGITVIAADCAPLQPRPACRTPAPAAARTRRARPWRASPHADRPATDCCRLPPENMPASASTAAPHSMPPSAPPLPARYSQTIVALLVGIHRVADARLVADDDQRRDRSAAVTSAGDDAEVEVRTGTVAAVRFADAAAEDVRRRAPASPRACARSRDRTRRRRSRPAA